MPTLGRAPKAPPLTTSQELPPGTDEKPCSFGEGTVNGLSERPGCLIGRDGGTPA
jgi:hypothetical protein